MYTLQYYAGNQIVILIMRILLIQRFIVERFHFNIHIQQYKIFQNYLCKCMHAC